jgi:hypothetical protein
MARYLALRDLRLQGGVPTRPKLKIINTNESTPLNQVFTQIKAVSAPGKIHSMFILCHGFAESNEAAQLSIDAGGMGLQIGRENLLHQNVDKWKAIRNKVDNIVVYACAAADTQPGNEFTEADGRYLMGALAIHTNSAVYAADKIQWYSTYNELKNGCYDFGAWEGQLWAFPPDGSPPTKVFGAPVDFSDVISGIAP